MSLSHYHSDGGVTSDVKPLWNPVVSCFFSPFSDQSVCVAWRLFLSWVCDAVIESCGFLGAGTHQKTNKRSCLFAEHVSSQCFLQTWSLSSSWITCKKWSSQASLCSFRTVSPPHCLLSCRPRAVRSKLVNKINMFVFFKFFFSSANMQKRWRWRWLNAGMTITYPPNKEIFSFVMFPTQWHRSWTELKLPVRALSNKLI